MILNMSVEIEYALPILEAVMRIRVPSDRRKVLLIMLRDNKLKAALRIVAHNVVEKKVPLTDKQKVLLRKYKSAIWKIRSKEGVSNVI